MNEDTETLIAIIGTAIITAIGFIGIVMLKFAISLGASLTALYIAHTCFHWF